MLPAAQVNSPSTHCHVRGARPSVQQRLRCGRRLGAMACARKPFIGATVCTTWHCSSALARARRPSSCATAGARCPLFYAMVGAAHQGVSNSHNQIPTSTMKRNIMSEVKFIKEQGKYKSTTSNMCTGHRAGRATQGLARGTGSSVAQPGATCRQHNSTSRRDAQRHWCIRAREAGSPGASKLATCRKSGASSAATYNKCTGGNFKGKNGISSQKKCFK
ncbi:hypothetical protein HAX54_006318 [Datura stramonium]|uniref:Uncharacterized protein n=1 Tax=Datura stramonium TaxID=4076 RepID=A0ABS8TA53_DATST|nr:hypothetical protein [Datura stramonium]